MSDSTLAEVAVPTTTIEGESVTASSTPSPWPDPLRIDLGCGAKKRKGHIGIDYVKGDGVDVVAHLDNQPLPFADDSVDSVFSSHFFEHTQAHFHLLHEMSRVCKPNSPVEIWTPYMKSDTAFLLGHVTYMTETLWSHYCIEFPEIWMGNLPAVMRLDEIRYVVSARTRQFLGDIPLWFAIRFMQNVCVEFGVKLTVLKGPQYVDKAAYKASVKAPKLLLGTHRGDMKPFECPPVFWNVSS